MTDPRRPLVIAIHGVGNPSPGEITSAVANNLSAGGIDARVSEFNWNQHVEYPINTETGGLSFFAFEEVAACSAYIGRLSTAWDAGSGERMPVYERLFLLAQLTVGLAIALLFFLPFPAIAASLASLVIEGAISLGWIWDLARGLVVAALASLALFLASGAIRTLSGRAEFRSTIRRGLLLILHPFLLLLLLPLLLFSGLVRRLKAKQFLAPIGFALAAIVFLLLPGKAGGEFAAIAVLWPAALLTSWALGLLARIVFGPGIKVLLDVIRYAGDSRYRHQLLEAFDKHVSRATQNSTEPRQCILLAHSLGSIIAIDSLLHGRSWHADSDVVLVTMGSPLRRLFFAFLPGHLLPRTTSRIHTIISSRVVRFRWLNVFRPWDQVGTSLGLNRNDAGRDVSTRQWRKVLSAHTDYWSDGVVRDQIADVIQRPQIPVTVDHAGAASPEVSVTSTSPWTGLLSALDSGRAMVLLVLLVVGSSVVLFSGSLWTSRTTAKKVQTLLDDSGVLVANARVEYWYSDFYQDSEGLFAWTIHLIFRFEADDASQEILIVTRSVRADLPHRLIDITRLDGAIQRERSPNEDQHVDYGPIVLRYVPRWQSFIDLPEGQAALDLPDYPPSKRRLLFADLFIGFWLALYLALIECVLLVAVYKYLFVRWFGLLLGVRTGDVGDPF